MKDFLLPSSFLLLSFLALATANAAGYRYGASDQAFYAPSIMQRLDPRLFPRDTPLLDAQARLTFADETIAAVSRLSGLGLPSLFVTLQVVTLALIAGAALCIGGVMYRERWTSVALLAAMSLRHAIARTGTNTLEGYFHPRQLAFAFGALAVCAFLRRRHALAFLGILCAAALHPTTTLWFAIWLYVAAFVAEPNWRPALAWTAAAAVPVVAWAFAAGPLAGRLVLMDAEWLAAIGEKDYLFPLDWPFHAWALNLGYAVVIACIWRARRKTAALGDRETALVVGCLSLVLVFGCALVFQARAIALSVQLQPARVFWMLDFLAVVYLTWLIAEYPPARRHRARAAAAAVTVALLATVRAVYVMRVEFPDRPLVEAGVQDDDWGRAMAWARSTGISTSWLADPAHAARYGTSVRVAGARDVFVEALKDAALGMYERDVAIRTRDRIAELGDFDALTPARARQLGATYNLDYLVTTATLDLPVAFEAGTLHIYRIR